jgi:DNA transformation protein and related proteins
MVSDQSFVDFIIDQMGNAGTTSQRKLFGEHTIYCDGKVVALICKNQFFVRPTNKGRVSIGNVVESSPHPGEKPHFLIEDTFENRDWIADLIKLTA